MIWLAILIVLLLPIVIWAVLVQEEAFHERRRIPMGWLRRLWSRPAAERRHCHRYRAAIPLTYRILNSSAGVAQTRDISLGGLGVVLYEKLSPGTVLELTLQTQGPAGPMAVQGQIQWVREVSQQPGETRRLFWAGVQLVHTGTASVDRLRAILLQISPDGRQGRV